MICETCGRDSELGIAETQSGSEAEVAALIAALLTSVRLLWAVSVHIEAEPWWSASQREPAEAAGPAG